MLWDRFFGNSVMPPLWPNSALFLQCKSRIISWTSTEIIGFILILTESRFWPEFFSVSPAEISSHWRQCHYGWGPESAKWIFSLAHISITSYVFDLLTLFLYLISTHLVTFTVIFCVFSNSVQLRKVTGMDRAWQVANIFCADLSCSLLCFGFNSLVYGMGCLFKCLAYIRAFNSSCKCTTEK